MRRVQYPEGDQDTTHSVDLPRSMLPEFLNNLDYDELSAAGVAEMEFQFHIAPKGYADPPTCKDKVSVRFFPDRCYFRLVVSNNFLVPPNWCHGAQVVYGFTIASSTSTATRPAEIQRARFTYASISALRSVLWLLFTGNASTNMRSAGTM